MNALLSSLYEYILIKKKKKKKKKKKDVGFLYNSGIDFFKRAHEFYAWKSSYSEIDFICVWEKWINFLFFLCGVCVRDINSSTRLGYFMLSSLKKATKNIY